MCKEKISKLLEAGTIQISSKYRLVAKMPEGKTWYEAMEEYDPGMADGYIKDFNRQMEEQFLRVFGDKAGLWVKLTEEEFKEFRRQRREKRGW